MSEIWKDIPDYEGLYQVSNIGRVKSIKREWIAGCNSQRKHDNIIMKYKIDNGYKRVTLRKNEISRLYKISRLVMMSFKGKSKLQVNHINGIKTDDRLENLEYCSPSENTIHAVKMGLIKRGGQGSILTEEQVRQIKITAKNNPKLHQGYWKELAESLNIKKQTICSIVKGRNWKHIEV